MSVTSPILVSTSANTSSSHDNVGDRLGPYVIGAKAYIFVVQDPGIPGVTTVRVFKSTDGRQTWSEQDSGAAPQVDSMGTTTENAGVFAVTFSLVSTLGFVVFDSATDTWGSPVIHSTATPSLGPYAVKLASGDIAVVYPSQDDPTTTSIDLSFIVSGAWSAQSTVITAPGGTLLNPVGLSADASSIHLLYTDELFAVPGTETLTYLPLTLAGSPGSPVAIETAATGSFQITSILLWNDRIIVPVLDLVVAAPDPQAYIWEGSPISSPAWTKLAIHGVMAGDYDIRAFPLELSPAAMVLYWGRVSGSPFPTFNRLYSTQYNGTVFSSPSLFWDEIANPVPNGPGPFETPISAPTGTVIAGSAAILTDQLNSGGNQNTYLLSEAVSGYFHAMY